MTNWKMSVCCCLQVKEKSSLPQRKYIFPNKQHRFRKHGASIHSLTVYMTRRQDTTGRNQIKNFYTNKLYFDYD